MTAILLVDDEAGIRHVVGAYLAAENYVVYTASDGQEALTLFRLHHPDLVILDLMLPKIDGLEVLAQIRRESDAYVLLLTARSEETDRVIGLTVGADDYLTKPFSPRELVARVKAILRRRRETPTTPPSADVLRFHHVRIDSDRREVWRGETLIDLTALEFELLKTLALHVGRVLSREQLLQQVWGFDFYGDSRVVDVHIGHIRQKLEPNPAEPQFILTVRGVGYRFEDTSA